MTIPLPSSGSTSWTPWAAQVDSQARHAQPGPALHTDYRTKADGALPTTGDEGVTIANPRNSVAQPYVPTISSGRLVSNIPSGIAGASYIDQDIGAKANRIGAIFAFTAGDADGAICLAAWDTPLANPTGAEISSTHIHFVIGPQSWHYGVWSGNVFTEISNGSFAPALPQDGTLLHTEVRIDGSTATVVLPDNTANTITDSRIGSITGTIACWEFFKNSGTSCLPTFAAAWADSSANGLGLATPAGVARLATGMTPYVAVKEYIPGAATHISPTTSYTAVDATNLTLNQRAGPTGGILVTMQAWLAINAPGGAGYWTAWGVGLGVGANVAVGSPEQALIIDQGGTTAVWRLVTISHTRTGLTPGQIFTVQWQHYALAASSSNYIDLNPPYGMSAVLTATPV